MKKEVIIVGGGPAGTFTALYLAAKCPWLAKDIVLLEAQPQGREKVCAGGVSGRVMKTAREDLGIDISSLPGRDVEGMMVRVGDWGATADKPGLGRVIRRELLDSFLLDRVKERGVTVLTETPVGNIVREPRSISAETAKGTFTGRVLVGADGMSGITEKALGVRQGKHEYLYMVDLPGVEVAPRFMLDYTPVMYGIPGYFWVFPEAYGANIGITGGSADNMKYLKKVLLLMAAKNGIKLDEGEHKFKTYPERFFSFSTPSHAERVLFVGDKLGVTPMTGEGIGICLHSAKAAADEIIQALGGCDYSFRKYPRRLFASDFVPTWYIEKFIFKCKTPVLLKLLFKLATSENREQGKAFIDNYCSIFAGDVQAWSFESLGTLLRLLPSRKLLGSMVG